MIIGFLENLLCMVSATRHRKRWLASIKLSKWEIENRARKARFEELYPDYQPTPQPFYGCSNNAPWYRAAVERERLLEEWWGYYLDETHRRGGEFAFPLIMPDSNAAELYVAPIGLPDDFEYSSP